MLNFSLDKSCQDIRYHKQSDVLYFYTPISLMTFDICPPASILDIIIEKRR